jgi:hypothetical protein
MAGRATEQRAGGRYFVSPSRSGKLAPASVVQQGGTVASLAVENALGKGRLQLGPGDPAYLHHEVPIV